MKKTISILLIVTMLLSMLVVAIPAGAEVADTNTESVFVPTWTGEHKTEAELESETGKDFTVITNYADFDAITSGTSDAVKYYCVILPEGTETLVMSGKTHLDGTYLENVYIDFNGYTVDVSGINNGLFNKITKSTVKNLKMIGDLYCRSASWTGAGYNYVCEEVGMSPLLTGHLTAGTTESIINLDNVVSEVNMVVSAQHGGGKLYAGLLPQTSAGSVVKNCVFNGTITVETDTANSKVSKAHVGRLGGITAQANNTTFENCLSAGTIVFDDDIFFGTDSNSKGHVGGIVGYASGNTSFNNCENQVDITVNAYARASASDDDKAIVPANIGGIAGNALDTVSFKNCVNGGAITVTAGQNRVGGIVGNVESADVKLENCSNSGAMKWTSGGATGGTFGEIAMGLGGILGVANASIKVKNCDNTGSVTVENGAAMGSSAFGAGGVVGNIAVASKVENCTNDGAVTWATDRNGNAQAAGGIVGKIHTCSTELTYVTNCVNKANGTVSGTKGTGGVGIGGVVGFAKYSSALISDCENLADLSTHPNSDMALGGILGYIQTDADNLDVVVTIEDCVNNGELSLNANGGRAYVGGIVGKSYGAGDIEILRCTNNGDVNGDYEGRNATWNSAMSGSAGIMGNFDNSIAGGCLTITDCRNNGSVSAAVGGAGILGSIHRANNATVTITGCMNNGSVTTLTAKGWATGLGGIVGIVNQNNKGIVTLNIENCLNAGVISAASTGDYDIYVGGIVGGSSDVEYKSNAGDVINIVDVVNIGALSISEHASKVRAIGGIVGNAEVATYNLADDCYYWETSVSVTASNELGVALGDEDTLVAVEDIDLLVNKKAFRAEIEAITGEDFPGERKYTAASLAPLYEAVEAAIVINEIPVFTIVDGVVDFSNVAGLQAQVDAAYAVMMAAHNNLKMNVEAYKDIEAAIEAAEELYDSDKAYTSASWKNFIDAINEAKDVLADPTNLITPEDAIANLQAAIDALVLGGDIYTAEDFANLEGQSGVFYLTNDITVSAPINKFYGTLVGNGYTITLDGCGLFENVVGPEYDPETNKYASFDGMIIDGDAGNADSIFGKVEGAVVFSEMEIKVDSLKVAAIADEAAENAKIYVIGVISYADAGVGAILGNVNCAVDVYGVVAMADAPALVGTVDEESYVSYAYLDGKEYYDYDTKYTDAETFASGKVAYELNRMFGVIFVQVIGTDAAPTIGKALADGRNVVVPVYDENGETIVSYKNAGYAYGDDVPELPERDDEVKLDFTALDKAIADAEALDEAKYTAVSYATVKSFLAAAKSAKTAKSQTAIDVAAASLNSALAALVEVKVAAPVDYAALDAAIAKAESYNAADYSAGTWATLQTMLSMAKIAKTATTQNEVDQAVAALESAIASLKAPAATDAPKDETPKPTEPAKDGGCGSVVGGAAVVLTAVIALGAGISFKKKED